MFKRDALIDLQKWASSKYRTPLVLRGARQVGKTTVVNEFGKEFENYLYVNLEHSEASKLFDSSLPLPTLMDMFHVYCNKPKKKGRTLLFIDENGRAKVDVYLCRGKKEYDKRQTLKEKEDRREIDRQVKRY